MDSNTYIEAKNTYYDMDFCPGFWDWLEKQFHAGNVCSIESVYLELKDLNDELGKWSKQHKDHFIAVSDNDTQALITNIADHVMSLDEKSETDRFNFLAKADPWMIAKAATMEAVLVTHERKVPDNSKKVKIPNICEAFGVECINTFELLRKLEAKFVLV